jgi:integrase
MVRVYEKAAPTGPHMMVEIRFRWPGGGGWYRERSKAPPECRTAKQAKGWGERRVAELLAAGRAPAPVPAVPPAPAAPACEGPTLAAFAVEWLEKHLVANLRKRSTYVTAKSILDLHLLPVLGTLRLGAIDDDAIASLRTTWLAGSHGQRPTTSKKTINNRLSILSTILHVAKKWKRIAVVPCTIELLRVDDQQEAAFYDHETYERLAEAARTVDARIYAAVLLAGDAGLRRGEIIALSHADLDLKPDKPRVIVRHHVFIEGNGKETIGPVKGGKAKAIPCTPRLADALRAVRHQRGPRVLCPDDGKLTPKVLKLWIRRAERAAGLPETGRIHVYRHTFASHLAMAAVPAKTIQELARHSSLMTTARYMHLSPSAKDEGIAALDRSRRGKILASLDTEERKA